MPDWVTLRDYIRELLLDGKRSQHEDFQKLFGLYGEEKITRLAKEILKEEKKNELDEQADQKV